MQRTAHARGRRGLIAFIAAASALTASGALPASADAGTPARVALPDPHLRSDYPGFTASPANPQLTMGLRVYLSGRDPRGRAAAALAVSGPRNPGYARYLTPAQYEQRFGPSAAQVSAVRGWLASQDMTVTGASQHYITVSGTVAQVDAVLDTQITAYTKSFTNPVTGKKVTFVTYGAAGGYQCSHYWGQHTVAIPPAYGQTSAPAQLCGYTVRQLRQAYGITSSRYTGKGATIAVVLDDASPTMLADASQFFASQGVPGFAPGQYTENLDGDHEPASALQASCANQARTSQRRRWTWRPRTSSRRTRTWSTWALTAQATSTRIPWTR